MSKKRLDSDRVSVHIVSWLKAYADKAGVQGFVVGISGGVDSALTSSLCAMTGLKTICVQMPIHQPKDQLARATEHIEQLAKRFPNVEDRYVELTRVFDSMAEANTEERSEYFELALANTRARIRMSTLYLIAQSNSCLVSGTGNKVEDFGVGFYTKYGDGGVDISPIADLMKTEVFQLARFVTVPESILNAAPTDGLWEDDRGDEDQLGASYPELEWAMKRSEAFSDSEGLEGREKEVMDIYLRLNKANRHKMEPIPVCSIPADWKSEISDRIDSH